MVNPNVVNYKKTKLETVHVAVYNTVSSTPQTPTVVAGSQGLSAQAAVEKLSLLVDEGLVVRGPGDPAKASYVLA